VPALTRMARVMMYGEPVGPHTVSVVRFAVTAVGPGVVTSRTVGSGFTTAGGAAGVVAAAAAGIPWGNAACVVRKPSASPPR
jgi:hypothetical protein